MRKTFLTLSSVVALMATGAIAHAADLTDVPNPDAVVAADSSSFVKVCDAFGAGYFYIPGSETCLKVSGQVSVSAGYDHFYDEGYSAAEAYIDLDTASDTELGALKTKIRISSQSDLDNYTVFASPDRRQELELAYISLGGFTVGYQETLFDQRIGYGSQLDVETLRGDMNTTGISYLSGDLGAGFYAGVSVEDDRRGGGADFQTYTHTPDFAARFGLKDQPWGNFDVSGLYSHEADEWFVKGTADVDVATNAQLRFSAGYGDQNGDNLYLVAAAGKYAFTPKIYAFTGATFSDGDRLEHNVWTANAGVTWTPVSNLDVKGEVIYVDRGNSVDNYNPKISVVRSW
jgi:hypothetical protein